MRFNGDVGVEKGGGYDDYGALYILCVFNR